MRFRRGSYALLISKSCFPRLGLVLEELAALGTPATRFAKSLQFLRAEISRGAEVCDLEPFGSDPGEFTVTIHGFRTRGKVNERLWTIMILDIDSA
jgi:hypothetical protein